MKFLKRKEIVIEGFELQEEITSEWEKLCQNVIENPTSHEVLILFLMIKAKIIIQCHPTQSIWSKSLRQYLKGREGKWT